MSKPTIFISYSRKDAEWKDRLASHLGVAEKQGQLNQWFDTLIGAGEYWEPQIESAMNAASIAILLVTDNYLNSEYVQDKEIPILLQRQATDGLRVIPILVKPCDWAAVDWLKKMNLRPDPKRPISAGNEHQIDSDFTSIAKEIRELLKRTALPVERTFVPVNPDEISIARLPQLLTRDLFGREAELKLLDDAWANPATNVVTFVAWGGVGKTALVNHWVRRLARRNYDGAARVYAWSFYSQGTSDDRAATAEYFINDALGWFGDSDPAAGSPWDKGERLARLIRAQRTLLVLDGLEPLQQPPNELGLIEGRLKEQSMQALLRELAAGQPGLCVISTRMAVAELEDYESAVLRCDLDQLAPEAGAQLLRKLGVTGEDGELRAAAAEFGGHSLALTLLGGYLNEVFDGDVRRCCEIEALTDDAQHGGHARRVMASYEKWLGDGPELAVLRLLGLFDRPADAASIAVLRAAPAIPGLTDALFRVKRQPRWFGLSTVEKAEPINDEEWRQTLAKLHRIRLLAKEKSGEGAESLAKSGKVKDTRLPQSPPNFSDPSGLSETFLDAHPLLREHFRHQLKRQYADAWREGNNRLSAHFESLAKEVLPETFEGMIPLYLALNHSCEADRPSEALHKIYVQRICREEEFFSWSKVGNLGADLAALANFFAKPWIQPLEKLTSEEKAAVLSWAGALLSSLGKLNEAIAPVQMALGIHLNQLADFENAAKGARSLSELCLSSGKLKEASDYGRKCVDLAYSFGRKSAVKFISYVTLANALHMAGHISEAESNFREGEERQKEIQPEYPLLYGAWGFRYCELLLEQDKYQEVQYRIHMTSKYDRKYLGLLDAALENLSLGKSYLLQAQHGEVEKYDLAADTLKQVVGRLRQAGEIHHLPRGLLARAVLYRLTGDHHLAKRDLDEALRIATRGSMRLHQADCQLEFARLSLATDDVVSARKAWETAKAMIEDMGYHRRDGEVKEIEEQLG